MGFIQRDAKGGCSTPVHSDNLREKEREREREREKEGKGEITYIVYFCSGLFGSAAISYMNRFVMSLLFIYFPYLSDTKFMLDLWDIEFRNFSYV